MRATMYLNVKPASCAPFSACCAKPPWSRMSAGGVCVLRYARWTRHTLICLGAGTVYCAHGSPRTQILWPHNCCFNAQDPCVAMSVEAAHQRLGIAEGVIHELQEQRQRVSAGHQAMTDLRSMVETRSRVRLVEPKTLMPDLFGKKNGPSWRTLVVSGERLRWRSARNAEAGDEERREPEAADLCDASST